MKIFVDENISRVVASALHQLVEGHKFDAANHVHLAGVDDVTLYADLHDRDYSMIITRDEAQLKNTKELAAIRESSLIWVGVPQPEGRGLTVFAADIACVSLGLLQCCSLIVTSRGRGISRGRVNSARMTSSSARIRTGNPAVNSRMLCRLSYRGSMRGRPHLTRQSRRRLTALCHALLTRTRLLSIANQT